METFKMDNTNLYLPKNPKIIEIGSEMQKLEHFEYGDFGQKSKISQILRTQIWGFWSRNCLRSPTQLY